MLLSRTLQSLFAFFYNVQLRRAVRIEIMSEIILEASDVWCSRAFRTDDPSQVRGVSLQVARGEQVHLYGPPQGGKNLLLHVMGLLEAPDRGRLRVLGNDTQGWSSEELSRFRSAHVGFLFSSPYLLPDLSVVENVAMPYFKLGAATPEQAQEETLEMLELAGVGGLKDVPIARLSGEQQQRVALARALITRPNFLVAEEPCATMDAASADVFLSDIRRVAEVLAMTLVWSGGEEPASDVRAVRVSAGRVEERIVKTP